ncbi:MAG: hemerythrin domain-containing protein [Bacteroidota bacterium]
MNIPLITHRDILADVIHTNHRVLMVLERMGIKLGVGNRTIEQIAETNGIQPGALVVIINLFCNEVYTPTANSHFDYIPDFLKYLKKSHQYFLTEKIPAIQRQIQQLVHLLHDSKAHMVESFYNEYIEEVTEHIEYENETVFPFIEEMYDAFLNKRDTSLLLMEYDIGIYDDQHGDVEDMLKDLKNVLIRHLPQTEVGSIRRRALEELFELESDLSSHTRIEDDVLIPLVKKLEGEMRSMSKLV